MVINELKERYEKNNEVKFKLFSLEYIIQKVDDKVVIYVTDDYIYNDSYVRFGKNR